MLYCGDDGGAEASEARARAAASGLGQRDIRGSRLDGSSGSVDGRSDVAEIAQPKHSQHTDNAEDEKVEVDTLERCSARRRA
ncbi:hypothetical protein JCM24511_09012 [Saitozyma sp. JCM 24511]|nr:hypothetical protein JCM24511_09012 [Saitozyma sp. JCM 24511]